MIPFPQVQAILEIVKTLPVVIALFSGVFPFMIVTLLIPETLLTVKVKEKGVKAGMAAIGPKTRPVVPEFQFQTKFPPTLATHW
jgi:hypothetical protein